jgi:hypothetical protein
LVEARGWAGAKRLNSTGGASRFPSTVPQTGLD